MEINCNWKKIYNHGHGIQGKFVRNRTFHMIKEKSRLLILREEADIYRECSTVSCFNDELFSVWKNKENQFS